MAPTTKKGAKRPRNGGGATSLERIPTHKIQRSIVFTNAAIATDQGFIFQVDPTSSGDFTELGTVFDQYRIAQVDFEWVLARNDTAELPTLVFAPDFNDVTVPTLQGLLNYETSKVVQFSEHRRQVKFSYKPKARIAVAAAGAGGGTSDVSLSTNTWCSTTQSIQWLGLKWFLVGYNSTANPQAIVTCYVRIHYEFKNSR